jgi:hypothetical protein
MSDQMKATLEEILKYLQRGIEQVGSVTQEQIPLLVQEYLKWGFAEAMMAVILCVTMWAVFPLMLRSGVKSVSKDETNGLGWLKAGIGGLGTFVAFAITVDLGYPSLMTAIQIYVAPRVYLLEQVKELMK